MTMFIVKLRSPVSRSWGNELMVDAASALEAAEASAGEPLRQGPGERKDLRARVWSLPFGAQSDVSFYAMAPSA